MDAFFLPLVTAALAEQGDKTQILAMLLAARYGKPGALFAAAALAAAINSALAAFGGSLVANVITDQASLLFLALGFAFAGAGAFLPFRDPDTGLGWKIGAFPAAFIAMFLTGFGDKTQFLTAGYGAVSQGWGFVAAGSAIGIVAGTAPAIVLGAALRERAPLPLARRVIGGGFLLVSAILSINVFSLI